MSMKFTPAASMRTSACPLAAAGVGSSTSFIASGPPGLSTRMAFMRPSRHVEGAASRGGRPWRRPRLPRAVAQLLAAAPVPALEARPLPRIPVPAGVEGVAGALELAPLAVAGALPAVLDAAGRLPADIGFGLGGGSNGERGGPRCDQAADDPVHGEILLPRPTGPGARIFAPSSAFEGPASAGDARSGRARRGL